MRKYMEYFNESGRSFEMYTSKGCPNSCVYCYRVSGRKVRTRPVEDVLEEMYYVKNAYGIDRFSFEDDCFGVDKKWADEFFMKVKPMSVRFRFQASINTLAPDFLKKAVDSGLSGISMGIESGCPDILRDMKKNISLEKASDLISLLRKMGVSYYATFIIGMPNDSWDSIVRTTKFLQDNKFRNNFSVFYLTPYPGSELYSWALAKGLIKDELDYVENLLLQNEISINLTKYPDAQLREWKDYILKGVAGVSKK